ncbi:MAG: hypothetical protein ACE5GD_01145 [Candidatus Geothermarchaeales archaeon]
MVLARGMGLAGQEAFLHECAMKRLKASSKAVWGMDVCLKCGGIDVEMTLNLTNLGIVYLTFVPPWIQSIKEAFST